MHPSETTDQFRFSRGHPLVGWLLTGSLLAILLYFLFPLLTSGEEQPQGDTLARWQQAIKETSTGAICVLIGLGSLGLLVVLSVIKGVCASCSVVFDKDSGQVTRDWQLGLLRDKESHPLTAVVAIAYTVEGTGAPDSTEPSSLYRLRCYFAGDKSYELTSSRDEESIVKLARQLQAFLGHPTDGKIRRYAWDMSEKIGAARQSFQQLKEQASNPLTAAMAGLLAGQMERLEATMNAILPMELARDAPPDDILNQLRAGPGNPDLHMKFAVALATLQRNVEAAAVLERGSDLYAQVAAAPTNPECEDAAPRDPEKLERAHPVRAEPMHGLWIQLRHKPEDPGPYFLLAVALRTCGWASAARGCALVAIRMRQASGNISAAEGEEMLRDFPSGPPFGLTAIF
jgi:hypothetical protein